MQAISTIFAQRVRLARRSKRLTQTGLAVQLHVRVATVCGWEHGHVPNVARLRQLSSILGVSTSWLIGVVGDPAPVDHLTNDEREWLAIYRDMKPERRQGTKDALRAGEDLFRSLTEPSRS